MWKRIQKYALIVCDILEILAAIIVGVAIVTAIVALVPGFLHFWVNRTEAGVFLSFLEEILNVVIGIEFLKMLCKPSSEHVIEGLVFLVARHMIVGTTTAQEDLLSIIGIAILYVLSRFMVMTKNGRIKDYKGIAKDSGTERDKN